MDVDYRRLGRHQEHESVFIGDLSHGDGGDCKEPETGSCSMEVSEKKGVCRPFLYESFFPLRFNTTVGTLNPFRKCQAQYLLSRRGQRQGVGGEHGGKRASGRVADGKSVDDVVCLALKSWPGALLEPSRRTLSSEYVLSKSFNVQR